MKANLRAVGWALGIAAACSGSGSEPIVLTPWGGVQQDTLYVQVQGASGGSLDLLSSDDLVSWTHAGRVSVPASGAIALPLSSNRALSRTSPARTSVGRFFTVQAAGTQAVNAVGYANVDCPAGFSLLANPLDNGQGNRVADLIAGVPDATVLYRLRAGGYGVTVFEAGVWDDPDLAVAPGEGCFLRLPQPTRLTFVGQVLQGRLVNPIPAGWSIRASLVPQNGLLTSTLGFPATDGDVVYLFERANQRYTVHGFEFGMWDREPWLAPAEAFIVRKAQAADWVRDFQVTP